MKTLQVMVFLFILSALFMEDSEAQSLQKEYYQKVSGISVVSVINPVTPKLMILNTKSTLTLSSKNSHSKKKIKPYISDRPALSDRWWYQMAAYLFNSNMNTRYPSRTVSR